MICGAPNVGKSSLLNLLSGHERAIVSPQAGTTRDTIEEVLQIHGLPFRPGGHGRAAHAHAATTSSPKGMERTRRELERADVIIEVVDGSLPQVEAQRVPVPAGQRGHILVLNKADLGVHSSWGSGLGLRVSCETGAGIETLRAAMRDAVWSAPDSGGSQLVAINARHQRCFQRAAEAVVDARAGVRA